VCKTTAENHYRNAILAVTVNGAQSCNGWKWKSFVEKQSFMNANRKPGGKIRLYPEEKIALRANLLMRKPLI
jgi:hypothetical protein